MNYAETLKLFWIHRRFLTTHFRISRMLTVSTLVILNPYSAEFKNGMFQFWILSNSFWHIRGFLAKIWIYDKQCSSWSEGSSRSHLGLHCLQKVYTLVSSTIRAKPFTPYIAFWCICSRWLVKTLLKVEQPNIAQYEQFYVPVSISFPQIICYSDVKPYLWSRLNSCHLL